MDSIKYHALKDEGGTFDLDGSSLQFVPAHYLHSSGNFHVYDAKAKI
jgi:flavorubredoxin